MRYSYQAEDTLKWTWRQKFLYMLTLLSKGVPTKLLKFFRLKIFFICHRCQRHRWSTLSCEYLREFWKKFEMVLMGYSGAGGKLIHKKNQKRKISYFLWHPTSRICYSHNQIIPHHRFAPWLPLLPPGYLKFWIYFTEYAEEKLQVCREGFLFLPCNN